MNCCNKCNKCGCEGPCGCAKPILDIGLKTGSKTELSYNINGLTSTWDYYGIVQEAQTDTTLSTNQMERSLVYNAERHINTISAKELGSILHVADLGDVDITGVQDNSLFVYQKNSDCAEGCEGIDNSWIAWNESDHRVSSGEAIMVFDQDSKPRSLNHPANTNQHYQLSWAAGNKISWTQPVEVATPPKDGDNKVYRVYMDPSTKQLVYVKEDA